MDPIKITDEAVSAIKAKTATKDGALGLRLVIKSTGCSGNSYQLDYATSEDLGADDKIERDGAVRFSGKVSTSKLHRRFETLTEYLLRANPVPAGTVLLTGTGIIVPENAALAPGVLGSSCTRRSRMSTWLISYAFCGRMTA